MATPSGPFRSRRSRRRQASRQSGEQRSSAAALPPLLLEARQAAQQGRHDQSLELYEAAVSAMADHPQRVAVLAEAARACAGRFEVDRAEALLQRLVDAGQAEGRDQATAMVLAGTVYFLAYRPERAMECYRKAAELAPTRPAAGVELAALLERRGKLDQAEAALAAIPAGVAEADNVRARIARRRGEPDKAAAILRPICDSAMLSPMVKARAGYELARLLDEQNDYPAAWKALLSAKNQQRSVIPPGQAAAAKDQLARHKTLIDTLTADHFRRCTDQPVADDTAVTPAILTGLPRSGTTLMLRMLQAHPAIASADERHVLAKVALPGLFTGSNSPDPAADPLAAFDKLSPEVIGRQRHRYFDLMGQSLGRPLQGKMLLDKNPAMLRLLPGVRRLLPDAKLIVALRDPRDVLVSMLFTWMPINDVSMQLLNPADATAFCVDELAIWLRLREMINNYHELRYEALVANQEQPLRLAVDYLGLEWPASMLGDLADPGPHVDSPTYEQVAKPVYASAIDRWRHYEPMLGQRFDQLRAVASGLGYG